MSIEELLDCDASTLEAMSDAELLEHFKGLLPITRPEMQAKKVLGIRNEVVALNPKALAAANIMKGLGVNVDLALFRPVKKKK